MIKVQNLVKSYGDTPVLKGIDLELKEGEARHFPFRRHHSGCHFAGCFPSRGGGVFLLYGDSHHAWRQRPEGGKIPAGRRDDDGS